MVVGKVAKTAAEGQELAIRISAVPDALVLPFSNGAPHERRVFVEEGAVIGQ